MAIIKPKAVRELNEKDLLDRLAELKLELSKERASSEIGTVKNPGRIREIRTGIARLLTEKRSREIKSKIKAKPVAAKPVAKVAKEKIIVSKEKPVKKD